MVQLGECLLSLYETLGSIPSPGHSGISCTQEVGLEEQECWPALST